MSAFTFPGTTPDQLIDLFDAAALASMRIPPNYIDIQFYDARLGANKAGDGGVSGSVPDKIYTPSEPTESDQPTNNGWDDLAVVDFFVANDKVFQPENDFEFVLPYSTVAKNITDLNQTARKDLKQFLEFEPELDVDFTNKQTPFFIEAVVGTEGDMRRYIGLLYLKAGNKGKADKMREMYARLYGKQFKNKI